MKKKEMQHYKENYSDFDALKLTLASPEQILNWSYGELTKSETINYRTYKPEPDGLFCEKIFGPTKNYECYCGKYKKVRYKGIVCDKCGVEVTRKDVRRERLGHISLVVPTSHVWYAYGIPNKMSIVLDMPQKKILSVLYYTRYIVVSVEDEKRKEMVEKVQGLRKKEKENLDKELTEELKIISKDFASKLKDLKKSEKKEKALKFKQSQLEHEEKQALAIVRRDFAELEEELDEAFTRLENLIENIVIGTILTEDDYVDMSDRGLVFFEAQMGAEAMQKLLSMIDIEKEIERLRKDLRSQKGAKKTKTIRRLQYLEGFKANDLDPTWMIISILPVLSPELRPIVPISGGKFATHDLNDLYRRIINRNNRLRRLIEIGAPDVILRNEKRMLQESVDALIDNQHRPSKPMMNTRRIPYKSLTDELRGKKGIFRKNLLGKRVDYSGRAVIVGDATLTINECGIPKSVALEIFKPFVIHEILKAELAVNIRIAKDMIEEEEDIVWDLLQKIVKNRPVLLNRAPTLHKYSIQAFFPRLVEGEAIRLHPLVCRAFNADFDGDTMSVHLVLVEEAIKESFEYMLASKNIISIANGKILASPERDMLLGYFLMTNMRNVDKPRTFGSFQEAIRAYDRNLISIDEKIVTRGKDGKSMETSVGRIILNGAFPEDYPYVNERIGKSEIGKIIEDIKNKYPLEILPELLDELKKIGFKYATDLGFSFAMEDCEIEMGLPEKLSKMEEKDKELEANYLEGLITEQEKFKLSTNMWADFGDDLEAEAWETIVKDNPVYEMVQSGANGGKIQARQILTIKGMVRDSSGHWVPLPIRGNYRDGLDAFEYFVAANGGRKGISDKSLRTSDSGYLTRRLVDVAHDVIIRMDDCGVKAEGFIMRKSEERRLDFVDRIYGRYLNEDVLDKKGKVVVKKNQFITVELAKKISESDVEEVCVRSPISCEAPLGMCKKCYGYNTEINSEIEMGKAVGVIAAQSIGEPGTQMTMQTFHKGGVQRTDITQGFPRLTELFEARTPKVEASISSIDGVVNVEVAEDDSKKITIVGTQNVIRRFVVNGAKKVNVKDGEKVKTNQVLFIDADEKEKQAPFDGVVKVDYGIMTLEGVMKAEEEIKVLPIFDLFVKSGDKVSAGQQLTEGVLDPKKLAEVVSIEKAQEYIVNEIQKVFAEQGISIMDVHIEIIVRQMARLGSVLESGDSDYLIGDTVNRFKSEHINQRLRDDNKNIALIVPKLLGIKASALKTESFLSAMSFQEQVRVLTHASILGKVDYLRGMKENVMIGRKIPTGEEARIENVHELDEILS
jgi:DNA-directed RNA polymerase subunit beta'